MSTQSGIFYQNSIAAVYLGGLLDTRAPVGRPRIHSVRIEAPGHIDDIVVHYADGSILYIEAKERLRVTGPTWRKVWLDVKTHAAQSRVGRDRVVLVVGTYSASLDRVSELENAAVRP